MTQPRLTPSLARRLEQLRSASSGGWFDVPDDVSSITLRALCSRGLLTYQHDGDGRRARLTR